MCAFTPANWKAIRGNEEYKERLAGGLERSALRKPLEELQRALGSAELPLDVDASAAAASVVNGMFCWEIFPLWVRARGISFAVDVIEVVFRRGLTEECDGSNCWIVEDPSRPDFRYASGPVQELGAFLRTADSALRQEAQARAEHHRRGGDLNVRWAMSSLLELPEWIDADVQAALEKKLPFPLECLAAAGDLSRATQLLAKTPADSGAVKRLGPRALELVSRRGRDATGLLGELSRVGAEEVQDKARLWESRGEPLREDSLSCEVTLDEWDPLLNALSLVGGAVGLEGVGVLLSETEGAKLVKAARLTREVALNALLRHPAQARKVVQRHAKEPWAKALLPQLRGAA